MKDQKFAAEKEVLTIEEIGTLGNAMREAEAEGGSRIGIAAVKALLGCRRHEILALPVSWFDAKARCIRFGDTKSDDPMQRPKRRLYDTPAQGEVDVSLGSTPSGDSADGRL